MADSHRIPHEGDRLVEVSRLAAILGWDVSTVHRRLTRYGVPRRDAWGFEKEDGRGKTFVYISDWNAHTRERTTPASNRQCRGDLRRAGLLPS